MRDDRDIYVPPDGPPTTRLNPNIYQKMGEDNIFRMLEDFYLELEKSEIRHLFPEDMVYASKKSAAFFVFLMGGPPLYHQKYGPPMMRKRHLPFMIDERARQIWLGCFRKVLENSDEKYSFPKENKEEFIVFLEKFSQWMVNSK